MEMQTSKISQGHLGGRDGSNACTLIAISLGRMFCLNESELAIPNQNSEKFLGSCFSKCYC